MSRIAVAGVIVASTAMGTGVAVKMGALDFLEPVDEARVTITHVDLATFTAQTQQGSVPHGRVPVKIILRLPGLYKAQDICRAASGLRKVILRELYRNPVPVGRDNKLELSETESRLLKVTNAMMRNDNVSDVIVINNSAKAKPDSLEFTNLLSCRKLLAMPSAKEKRRRR